MVVWYAPLVLTDTVSLVALAIADERDHSNPISVTLLKSEMLTIPFS